MTGGEAVPFEAAATRGVRRAKIQRGKLGGGRGVQESKLQETPEGSQVPCGGA